ncbi:pyridoxamine 5'-phosphate oxidase family protein [Tsukamurella sp. DT100]|uniref:pyridoxamine 5'-phosphate oxidase family protein n=1 Tax=Tsukamurella sp. DT100 TaxID=3393415 RepID=UPI003CE7E1EF
MHSDLFGHLAPATATRFRDRLNIDLVAWLTLVTERGTPQPAPVWFLWNDADQRVITYSQATAKRLDRIALGGRASLHLNDDGNGHDYLVMTGIIERLGSGFPPADAHAAFAAKYQTSMNTVFGSAARYATTFSVPLAFTPHTVRGN